MSAVTNLKAFDSPKKLKASEYPWDTKLWEPLKAEVLKHVKLKMSIPKGKSYAMIQSVANKGKVAMVVAYSIRECSAYVSIETYGGEEIRDKIMSAMLETPDTHPIRQAELTQGKRNKNKWAWSICHNIDKADGCIVKWYADTLLPVYTLMEDVIL